MLRGWQKSYLFRDQCIKVWQLMMPADCSRSVRAASHSYIQPQSLDMVIGTLAVIAMEVQSLFELVPRR